MRLLAAAAFVAFSAIIPGQAAPAARDENRILPGYWEYTNRLEFLFTDTKVEKRCVKPEDVDKFLAGPSNRHYKCDYPTRVVGGGKARFEGVCRDKRGREAKVSAVGSYAPKAFHLDATLGTSIGGLPISPTASVDAKWLAADCPDPDAAK